VSDVHRAPESEKGRKRICGKTRHMGNPREEAIARHKTRMTLRAYHQMLSGRSSSVYLKRPLLSRLLMDDSVHS